MLNDTPPYNEIIKSIQTRGSEVDKLAIKKIAVLSNVTISSIDHYLTYFCLEEHMFPDLYLGNYDQVMQEVMLANSGLYQHEPDIIILCLKKEVLSPDLAYHFTSMNAEEIEAEQNRILEYVRTLLISIRKNSQASILFNNFTTSPYTALGTLDYQSKNLQINTFRRLNLALLDLVKAFHGAYLVDFEMLQSFSGQASFIDHRYWHFAKAPFSRTAAELIAYECFKFIRALDGKTKKCLVLDADNTLWGGIIGEDGLHKIQLGETYPGSMFKEFQELALELHHRGVILALCSKNNYDDVIEVLENHPYMALRKEHFAAMMINWENKAANLQALSQKLNIGLDSMVFVDDNLFEIGLVEKMLPAVTTIHFDNPIDVKSKIIRSGIFDSLSYSNEDRMRTKMYQEEENRQTAATQLHFSELGDYLAYLEMEVTIKDADEKTLPRIAQLVQRTNQFNFTTKRYAEKELETLVSQEHTLVRCLHLKDRFGDLGIVGVTILKLEKQTCTIDSFLLSCRALGRGVEQVFLKDCERLARIKKCRNLVGMYMPTKKNQQIQSFYLEQGFSAEQPNVFTLELDQGSIEIPTYFKQVAY